MPPCSGRVRVKAAERCEENAIKMKIAGESKWGVQYRKAALDRKEAPKWTT